MPDGILIDTNVLLRLLSPADPSHKTVERAVRGALDAGFRIVLVPQVVMECWVVLTRPRESNGFGWQASEAAQALVEVQTKFPVLPETQAVFSHWWEIVKAGICGKRAHDARLVAAMNVHELRLLMTFNIADFASLPAIVPFHPEVSPPVPLAEGAADVSGK